MSPSSYIRSFIAVACLALFAVGSLILAPPLALSTDAVSVLLESAPYLTSLVLLTAAVFVALFGLSRMGLLAVISTQIRQPFVAFRLEVAAHSGSKSGGFSLIV